MNEPCRVVAYAGYRGEEEPRYLVAGGRRIELAVERRWREPDARYYRARDGDGRSYLLRLELATLSWSVLPE